jgi:hypothetical protein
LNQEKDVGNKALGTCDFPQRLKFWTHQLLSIIFYDYAAFLSSVHLYPFYPQYLRVNNWYTQKMKGWIWVCLKIGYIPNYSHLIGIMIINHWV